VKAPIDILGLSNGARSGLTGFVAGLARQPQLASRNVTINNLLPGPSTPTACAPPWPARRQERQAVEEVMDERRRAQPHAPLRHTGGVRRLPAPSCAACTPATSPGRTC
jgi:3-oxoacyl-[acyl-carrier protein] reductase